MSTCLKIGHHLLDGDQIISALVKYQILETLVGQVLLDQVLEDVPLSERELFNVLVKSAEIPMPEDFEDFLAQWCQAQNVTPTYLNNVLLRQLRVEKFKQLYFSDRVESEFLRHRASFDQVEYSLIQLNDSLLAQELYFQLRDDAADFALLAQQYSLDSERQSGGRVGPVPLSTLPDEVAALFRSKPPGFIHTPVAIEGTDRVWIVRLEQFTAAHLTEATRTTLINQLYGQWLQSQVKALIATPGAIAYGVQPHAAQPPEELSGSSLTEATTEGSQP
jgi:hypothetical protein